MERPYWTLRVARRVAQFGEGKTMTIEIRDGVLRVTVKPNDTFTDTNGEEIDHHGPEATFERELTEAELVKVADALYVERFAVLEMAKQAMGGLKKEIAARQK